MTTLRHTTGPSDRATVPLPSRNAPEAFGGGGQSTGEPAFLGLTEADCRLLDKHRETLARNVDDLAADFHALLLRHTETTCIVSGLPAARLQRMIRRLANHARLLLSSHRQTNWLDMVRELGRFHHRLGVETTWISGTYRMYWMHWGKIIREEIPPADRDALRDILFRLLVGDLMAQLDGYAWATRDTDTERLAVFDVLLQVLAAEETASDPDGQRLLDGICQGLVSRSHAVVWTSYAVQDYAGGLNARCMAGIPGKGFAIRRAADDPCWEAIDRKEPVIRSVDDASAPEWMAHIGGAIAEIGCFPFGAGGLSAVGLVGAREKGYFQRVGSAYFLAFAHLGDLVQRMRAQSLEDPLTGLPNRRLFSERLEHAFRQGLRQKRLLGVGMLDLDGFKQLNDRLGHEAGDMALREVAARLRRILRAGDTLARMGGDEFGLLLAELEHPDDLDRVCERVMGSIQAPFHIHGEPVALSASLGVTLYPFDESDSATLLRHADLALYAAKEQGRDQWQRHSSLLDARMNAKASVQEMLDRALREGRLTLHYQPMVEPGKHNGVLGVEALLRLRDAHDRLHGPALFAEALDHVRLARRIGCFVLESAFAQGESWHRQGLCFRMAVNISANHLLDSRFPADLEDALHRHPGLPPRWIEIEVTESAPLRDFERAKGALAVCNRLGVRVALDDFGTGNASLAYLQKLPAQTLKIDQSFVRDMVSDPKDRAIVTGVITTARLLGLEVVAEGVETASHAAMLAKLQCHLVQGYAIARPMPADEIPVWLCNYHAPVPEGA